MVYAHESNIDYKMNNRRSTYYEHRDKIREFYEGKYKIYREKLELVDFISKDPDEFSKGTKLIEDYLSEVENFSTNVVKIDPRSGFRSSFIEEISEYLFKDLPLISEGPFGIYNQNIFAGMKINNQMNIDILKKNVDFCIGKEVKLKIDDQRAKKIIIPIICVEAKTYLDATMFGEVQWSSRQIKNASPNVKTYVLMENNEVTEEKIIAARYDNNLNEMFALRKGKRDDGEPIETQALIQYYNEISEAIERTNVEDTLEPFGKLFDRDKWF